MSDEEKKLAAEACEALITYFNLSGSNASSSAPYGEEALAKLAELRKEIGENVYFAERDGKTAVICGKKVFYVHNT